MSNLIQQSPLNPSIKFIDFGEVHLTAYEELNKYCVRVSGSTDSSCFVQVTNVIPSHLQHTLETTYKKLVVIIRDPISGFCLSLECELDYMAVCDLFSMPMNTHIFQSLLECDAVTESSSEA